MDESIALQQFQGFELKKRRCIEKENNTPSNFQPNPLKTPINKEISRHLRAKPPYDNFISASKEPCPSALCEADQGYLRPLQMTAGITTR